MFYEKVRIKKRLNKAIRISPIKWVKSQKPDLGILTRKEAKEITEKVRNSKARNRMGLKPLGISELLSF